MISIHARLARIGLLAVLALLASLVLAMPVAAQQQTGDVTVNKTDAMTGDPVEGACFEIRDAEDNPENSYPNQCTDEAGQTTWSGVVFGEYNLVETDPAPGYAPTQDRPVTVDEATESVDVENQPTTITVNKFDAETGDPLADACFIVTNEDAEGGDFTSDEQCTDETGTTVFTQIAFGDYRVYETTPPPGYALIEEGFPVSLSAEEPHASVDIANASAEPQGGTLFLQKLNCQGVDEAEIRVFEAPESQDEADLIGQYPGFITCAFGEGTFEITGGDLEEPIVLHTDVFGSAFAELEPGTYEISETSPNQAGPEEFVVEEGDFWGALALNPMPAGQTPNVPAGGEPLPNTAEANVPGAPLAITMLALVALSVVGMTVRNVGDRRRR